MATPTRVRHPIFSRLYAGVVVPMMTKAGADELRGRLLAGLSGTVVEVGAGSGANFALYPDAVTRVVAVEPEPYLRARAMRAAAEAPVQVDVVEGAAGALPVTSASADAVVFCLVLCSVDQPAALAEAERVLRPGGEVRVLEHVQTPEPGPMRRVQAALDATVWPRLFGGCHCGQDTAGAVERAGFAFADLDRFVFPEGSRSPEAHAILGTATRATG